MCTVAQTPHIHSVISPPKHPAKFQHGKGVVTRNLQEGIFLQFYLLVSSHRKQKEALAGQNRRVHQKTGEMSGMSGDFTGIFRPSTRGVFACKNGTMLVRRVFSHQRRRWSQGYWSKSLKYPLRVRQHSRWMF